MMVDRACDCKTRRGSELRGTQDDDEAEEVNNTDVNSYGNDAKPISPSAMKLEASKQHNLTPRTFGLHHLVSP